MAPELKEFFIKGEENCDLKNYNPWKSDVYSLGITLLECSELLICNNNIKSPDSFKRITEYYGDDFSHLLKLLIENFEIRPDFSELVFKEQYQAFFHVNNKNKNTIDTNKEGINESVSQEFKRLIEELKVSCDIDDVNYNKFKLLIIIIKDTEKEFEFALEKARNIEKQNLELKQRYNFSQENKKKNNFSDNLKMAEKKVSNTQ